MKRCSFKHSETRYYVLTDRLPTKIDSQANSAWEHGSRVLPFRSAATASYIYYISGIQS